MSDTLSGIEAPIYTGVWINWSRGRIHGSTLTLTQRDGATLTAFVALFVTYASRLLWRILCLAFHLLLSSKNSPRSGSYHQRQTILKNSHNAADGFWYFAQALYYRKKSRGPSRRYTVFLPWVLFCVAYWALLTAASVLSSQVSSIMGDETLISSPFCGRPILAPGLDVEGFPTGRLKNEYGLNRLTRAREYAYNCYTRKEGSPCRIFSKPGLEFQASKNASCPFGPDLCKTADGNILLDVRINTLRDLGLNLPYSESVDLRWLTSCGPLKTEGFKQTYNYSQEKAYRQYFYGPIIDYQNIYTMEPIDIHAITNRTTETISSEISDWNQEFSLGGKVTVPSPQIYTLLFTTQNGGVLPIGSHFIPIDPLRSKDADVFLVFLTANYRRILSPVEDLWYSSHKVVGTHEDPSLPNNTLSLYAADDESSPLACKVQFQVCDPGTPETVGCSPKESLPSAYQNRVRQGEKHLELLGRVFGTLAAHSIAEILLYNRESALVDNSAGAIVEEFLDPDLWQQDVVFWQQQFLAAIQASVVDGAIGTSTGGNRWLLASTASEKRLCQAQKIRSPAHTNFSVLWLSIVFGIGGLCIVTGWALEPLINFLNTRRRKESFRMIEWNMNSYLQLQRLAHETLGFGIWTNCDSSIPVSGAKENLAVLDMDDPKHPMLKDPRSTFAGAFLNSLPAADVSQIDQNTLGDVVSTPKIQTEVNIRASTASSSHEKIDISIHVQDDIVVAQPHSAPPPVTDQHPGGGQRNGETPQYSEYINKR